ncbi:MAG: Cd(II)/Pb(II)-responsive transcriptional regulator [Deltaproteobacteria bacterium]|jgi:DNA-binding transcriptional MerR regulator|nr:Cd(II)/Pb(II)-responsive transcriptional regulator [Deltaproteobacteria bacterium]
MQKHLSIGQLAAKTGCQPITVRFYEKKGLMNSPARQANNYRYYTEKDVEQLFFIRHCRYHGFSLDEIKSLLALREAPTASCGAVDSILDKQIKKLDEYIKLTENLRAHLIELRKKCPHHGPVSTCGIMKSLMDRTFCPCLHDPHYQDIDELENHGPNAP